MYTKDFLFGYSHTPVKIQEEYIKRWKDIPKISLVEFHESIINDCDRKFWIDLDDIKRSYDCYINGSFSNKYPRLPIYPDTILSEIIEEANNQIQF